MLNGKDNHFYGKHHTEEAKQKNREAHLGTKMSEETKRKMSESHRRNNVWQGRKHSETSILKMKIAKLGKKDSDEAKLNKSKSHIGRKLSEESKRKLSIKAKGRVKSLEHRIKIGLASRGRKTRLGFTNSKEHRERISKGKKGRKASPYAILMNSISHSGVRNPAYIHGLSHEPYTSEWKNSDIRKNVKNRDNNTCQLCGRNLILCSLGSSVHHIDYNKKNCIETNLILLCRNCHPRTNHGNRNEWTVIFEEMIWEKYWTLDGELLIGQMSFLYQ